MAREDRNARLAVAALFLTNGAIFANVLPRFPGIKADLELSNAAYGLALAAYPTGALAAGLTAGALIRRFRSSRMAVAGTMLTGLGLLVAGVAPNVYLFAAALLVAGAADAITDVAQNAHGLRVQRRYRRSILNSFHALWSVGAAIGGLMGAAAAGLDLSRGIHLGISAALFGLLSISIYRRLLPGPDHDQGTEQPGDHARTGSPRGGTGFTRYLAILALGLLAVCGSFVEDAGSSWAALYLSEGLGAHATIAAFGFVALVGAQTIGRLLGDRMVDRFGQRTVARSGGLIVAVGMGSALAFPSVAGVIAGFAAAGLGVATLVPAAMHGADELPGFAPGTGVTLIGWLLRVGFLVSPPLVGLVSDATSLRLGLLIVPLAGLLVVLLSGVLDNDRRTG